MPLSLATRSRWFKDATASYSDEEMHAALDVYIPNYASAIVGEAWCSMNLEGGTL